MSVVAQPAATARALAALVVATDPELARVAADVHPSASWTLEVVADIEAAERRLVEGGIDVVVVGLPVSSGALQRCRVARPGAMRVQVAMVGEPMLWDTPRTMCCCVPSTRAPWSPSSISRPAGRGSSAPSG